MRLIALYFFLNAFLIYGQTEDKIQIQFDAYWGDEKVELQKKYGPNEIEFTLVRFYISNLKLEEKEGALNRIEGQYLIDLFQKNQISLKHATDKKYKFFSFDLGIDSTLNSSGVYGGDLDPTNGMYWTWQSGFINIKIEGISPKSAGRKNEFHFHLGGYLAPFQSIQKDIKLKIEGNKIKINLKQFMSDIDLSDNYKVMSPGEKAVKLSKKVAQCFSFSSN